MMGINKITKQLIEIENPIDELLELRQRVAGLESLKTELEKSGELFKVLFYRSSIGIYIVQGGHFRLANHQFAEIAGYNEDELVGINPTKLVHVEDRDAVRENAVKMLKGELSSAYEFRMVTKSAKIKWVTETVAPISYQGERATLGNLTDITDRKQAEQELKHITAEMQRSNTELEQFAYVISHDLQEPLRMVSSYTQLLAKRYQSKLDADADEFITYAVDGAKRMQALLGDLLGYSRVGTHGEPFSLIDSEDIIKQAMANLKIAIEESGALVSYDTLVAVMADEGQLIQLFQNLIANAIKFCGHEPPRVHISAKRRRKVIIFSVRDNGIGIDAQHSKSIFEIFRRLHTREEYPGTGMGLSICKKIVERHGGHIWVQSRPGEGSTFYLTIQVPGGESR